MASSSSSSAAAAAHHHHHDGGLFCYPSIQQGGGSFVSVDPDQMFNLTATTPIDMIAFSNAAMWKGLGSSSSSSSSLPSLFPPQGLSLSLSSSTNSHHHHHHQALLQDQAGHGFLLSNSKFLLPAQDLLNEFCGLGASHEATKQKPHLLRNNTQWEEDQDNNIGNSSKKHHPLISSLEFAELQKRKTKLLAMLQEVDRRYKNYCNQMKAVVSSFEAVAGSGAARVYSALALKAMSRHFKCLKDGILDQIQATRKSMGEKEPAAVPGATKGETPRLKVIDQTLRQQRAFHQMSMMETHPWRPQRGLPERSVSILRAWLFEHFLHPYPSDVDKHILARQTGLSRSQVSNWFINARVRLWKPMVEEMYIEEAKENENNNNNNNNSSEGGTNNIDPDMDNVHEGDQKPARARLLRIDSECVSSIINNNSEDPKNQQQQQQEQCLGFGSMEIDFSSYAHNHQSFNGGAVSLTLGLQQHGDGNGVSLAAFPPAATYHDQGSVFYSREHIEECQTVQYSLLDGEGQSMPYRNLMGTQMLHDLA